MVHTCSKGNKDIPVMRRFGAVNLTSSEVLASLFWQRDNFARREFGTTSLIRQFRYIGRYTKFGKYNELSNMVYYHRRIIRLNIQL